MSEVPPDGGFLGRWSRRKQQAARPNAVPEPRPAEAREEPLRETPESPSVEPELSAEELARLPPLESIGRDTDLTAFLRKGVPQALRNAALRRMWSADPAIRDHVDVARDYAYDWNAGPGIPGFGPLREGTDTAAMAERIFKGVVPEPESEAAAGEADPVLPEKLPEPSEAAVPRPLPAAQADLIVKHEPGQEVAATGETPDEPPGEVSRRRHGRAMPV